MSNLDYVNAVVLLLILTWVSLGKRNDFQIDGSIILKDTTSFLKAVCCVSIILHHFALRKSGSPLSEVFEVGGAYFSVPMFFLLSSYGVCKSEIANPTTGKTFINHRLGKLLAPFIVVNILTLITYHICGANCSLDELPAARVNESFVLIGSNHYGLLDYLMSALGLKEIDAAMWFVYIIIYSYIAFLVSKMLFNYKYQTGKTVMLFTALVAILFFVLFILKVPIHIYRSLWAIAFGAVLYWIEKRFDTILKRCVIMVIAFVILILPIVYIERNMIMLFCAIFIPITLIGVGCINRYFEIKKSSIIALLSSCSYLIYLVHVKVLTLQWWYIGYRSALLAVLLSLLAAMLYKEISTRISMLRMKIL